MGNEQAVLIGIDQGTTGTTVLAVDSSLNVVAQWYGQHAQHRPGPGLLEHNPDEIIGSVVEGVRSVLDELGKDCSSIIAAGLANQGETVCAWDRQTGLALHNAIVWSDSRGGEFIDVLKQDQREKLSAITGLEPDSYFSAAKILWLLKNVPQVRHALEKEQLGIGTLDSWIIWKLSGQQVYFTDASTASRTMLYDICSGNWSRQAGELIGLPQLPMATVGASCGHIADLAHDEWAIDSLPLFSSLVDQPSSLFAHGCWDAGQTKITYGTGCFLLMNTGDDLVAKRNGLTACVGWDVGQGPNYLLDGAVYAAGSVIEWLQKDCGWISKACELDNMVANLPTSDGLLFVPGMDGLSAPHWERDVRGLLIGISLSTKPAEIVRAALDGIAHQVSDLVECMEASVDYSLDEIRVDGGLSGSNYLMQKQADLLGKTICVSENSELTALGAATMAGLATGAFTRQELQQKLRDLPCKAFSPKIANRQREHERAKWKNAVNIAKSAARIIPMETINAKT